VATIYDVARRAGVSTATVSRVLSRPHVVAPETRQKVLTAVDSLGFTPNVAAKNLRTFRTAKLLVPVPDLSNPFFSLILQGIEDSAQREGYAVLVGDTQHDPEREEKYALIARRRGLRIPNDLSVVGFDDIRYARTLDPPLTTVAQPMRQIGEGTVRLLLEILRGSEAPESLTLPHTLVVRSSTAPPRRG
jgi:DNA-binding LacI/PurR family transcriptional regulator